MSKTAGQKAYEKAKQLGWLHDADSKSDFTDIPWENLAPDFRAHWEAIATAGAAPELKSYAQILCDELGDEPDWDKLSEAGRSWYVGAANALFAEAKRRGDLW